MSNINTFYFPHDGCARNDQRVLMIRSEHGAAGYGIFWMLLETIFENGGHLVGTADAEGIVKMSSRLSLAFGEPKEMIQKVLAACLEVGLLSADKTGVYSRRLLDHISTRKALSAAGKKGAKAARQGREKKEVEGHDSDEDEGQAGGQATGQAEGQADGEPVSRKGKERKETKEKKEISPDGEGAPAPSPQEGEATKPQYGNPHVNLLIDTLKTATGLGALDGTVDGNRHAAYRALKKIASTAGSEERAAELIAHAIRSAVGDPWHARNMTGMSYVEKNANKLVLTYPLAA